MRDSLSLLRGKRVGLVTNQTGIDESGKSTIDLLYAALSSASGAPAAQDSGLRPQGSGLTALFSPEHGIRGTEDRSNIANERDEKTGLPVYSLFAAATIPPPDSLLRDLDAIVVDLFDIGTRTWTYVGVMLYTVRAAARRGIPVFVLDRPNPIGGRAEGAILDSAIANPDDPSAGKPARAYALYPAPLRHGLTMGEMARWFNAELRLGADLHVIPVRGWRRDMWWDSTRIPWVRPSPNMPSLTSALLYPALVPLEATNVSVGRGTATAFQRFGASWMHAAAVAASLNSLRLSGVSFVAEPFTPVQPGDNKFAGQRIPGVRIDVVDRQRVQSARVGAAIVWALNKQHKDSLRIRSLDFDLRFGSGRLREALIGGADPDSVIDSQVQRVVAWQQKIRPYLLYR
ncbi:MAG TPA: DUF1343 domain-containing protein [Gemmatimonadaceae bacterium]|nr:DUF1343 domain-containing protein [Gemmatimonadaceae bacterium]